MCKCLSKCAQINWRLYRLIRREYSFCAPEMAAEWTMRWYVKICMVYTHQYTLYKVYGIYFMLEAYETIHQRLANTIYISTHIMIGIEACDLIEFTQRKSIHCTSHPQMNTLKSGQCKHSLTHAHIFIKNSFSPKIQFIFSWILSNAI